MPILKNNMSFEALRRVRIFLNLEFGITRAQPQQQPNQPRRKSPAIKSDSAPGKGEQSPQELTGNRRATRSQVNPDMNNGAAAARKLRPENMIWIFGSGRSGSTWLRSMMGELENHKVWEEPLAGRLFGEFYEKAEKGQLRSKNFIMGEPTKKGWIKSIRNFIIDGAEYAHPGLRPDDYLVIKDPNASVGAPLLSEAIPESCFIFLVRDPRDVVASVLDGAKSGSWLYERKQGSWKQATPADTSPETFVKRRANVYLRDVGGAKHAYEIHQGPKVLVKYEDLRADPLRTMQRIYSTLGITVDVAKLARVVEKHAWENVPEEQKGEGKFYRKATPGGWREDLTERQVEIVEQTTAPLLAELYPQ